MQVVSAFFIALHRLFVRRRKLEIAHKSIQRVYLFQNRVEAQSYWTVLFAKTANAIGLLPEKRDTGNLQTQSIEKWGQMCYNGQ